MSETLLKEELIEKIKQQDNFIVIWHDGSQVEVHWHNLIKLQQIALLEIAKINIVVNTADNMGWICQSP